MAEQLAYAIITPYSLHKSRTGGIVARLVARTGLELVGVRMFAPSQELIRAYADILVSPLTTDPQDRRIQELIRDYVLQNFAPEPKSGRRRRVMVLLFKGEDAVAKVRGAIGNFSPRHRSAESIRDTYGDLLADESGQVKYFEPAVLAAPTAEDAEKKLKLWTRFSDTDGGILDNVIAYGPDEKPERTLVLIKPENFRFPSGKPGNMIDFFSRTGLFIVGIKVHRMSVAEAVEFYGPVREVLRRRLREVVGIRAKTAIEREFGFTVPPAEEKLLGEMCCPLFAEDMFESIVQFMSGRTPSSCPGDQCALPGSQKSIALVYEGVDAVSKIRQVLGPTDPLKAPPGSIRREFGSDIMVNAAHASDSVESAQREMGIIKVADNTFKQTVEEFYGGL